jgi:hypothetical protein
MAFKGARFVDWRKRYFERTALLNNTLKIDRQQRRETQAGRVGPIRGIRISLIVNSIILSLIMGLFGGFIPARSAARQPIADALRAGFVGR